MNNHRAIIYYGGFVHRAGGAYFHVVNIKMGLEELGWDVKVVTLDSLGFPLCYLPHLSEKFVNLFRAPLGFLTKAKVTKRLYRWFFSGKEWDLVIFEDIYLSWESSNPSVSMLHAVWSDNVQAFELKPELLDRLKYEEVNQLNTIKHPVITVSEPYKKYIVTKHFARYSLSKEIDVIPLGMDQSPFKRDALECSGTRQGEEACRQAKSIIYVGALEPRKNVDFLLKVYAQIYKTDSDYRLTIVGNGVDGDRLRALAHELAIPVRFAGRYTHQQVLDELLLHDTYVHPSVKESFSFALLEAKMSGLRTCALGQLEVPGEFIDVPMREFSVPEWSRRILDEFPSSNFHGEFYTYQNMTEKTLELSRSHDH